MEAVARRARAAGRILSTTPSRLRDGVLTALAAALRTPEVAAAVAAANAADVAAAASEGLSASLASRLALSPRKTAELCAGLTALAALPDPLQPQSAAAPAAARALAAGGSPPLLLRRVAVPLGVLAVIFESRPEAVVQIASLALKSGNAVILKGGREARASCAALGAAVAAAIAAANAAEAAAVAAAGGEAAAAATIPADAVQLVESRADVAALLREEDCIDLVIPRGSAALVREIRAATRIPVLGHADGRCAVYIDAAADAARAATIAVDSKADYPAACNAAESLLVHRAALRTLLPAVAAALLAAGVTLHCDEEALPVAQAAAAAAAPAAAASGAAGAVLRAQDADWTTEWLSLHMSVRTVADVREAADWINEHGSHHTDAIVTEDAAAAATFLARVDSAGVYHNASTRFADGFRYGFGAEVGISTSRLHARGPVGLEGLLTYKYTLSGAGHCVAQFSAAAQATGGARLAGVDLPAMAYAHDV